MTEKNLKNKISLWQIFCHTKYSWWKLYELNNLQDLKHCVELAESPTMNAKLLLIIFVLSVDVTTSEGIGFTLNSWIILQIWIEN